MERQLFFISCIYLLFQFPGTVRWFQNIQNRRATQVFLPGYGALRLKVSSTRTTVLYIPHYLCLNRMNQSSSGKFKFCRVGAQCARFVCEANKKR